jgi:2-(1,2-epoxy-1,2-dihydrophenyl)acetyl-CoA isomerase
MASDMVNFKISQAVGVITLDRPEARNAFSQEMLDGLAEALRACRAPEIRAVLITGSGDAFCAGADVREFTSELEGGGPDGISSHLRKLAGRFHADVIMEIRRLQKPVVAGVNGVAAGGGFSLMVACDLRVAADNARFLMAYANIGATADGGSTFFLTRLLGGGRAMELYLADQPVTAEAALSMGLISRVFPAAEFEERAMETAIRLAQGPTVAYGRVKALFDSGWQLGLEAQLDQETDFIADIALTQDFQEGIRAFSEKRRPGFQGK